MTSVSHYITFHWLLSHTRPLCPAVGTRKRLNDCAVESRPGGWLAWAGMLGSWLLAVSCLLAGCCCRCSHIGRIDRTLPLTHHSLQPHYSQQANGNTLTPPPPSRFVHAAVLHRTARPARHIRIVRCTLPSHSSCALHSLSARRVHTATATATAGCSSSTSDVASSTSSLPSTRSSLPRHVVRVYQDPALAPRPPSASPPAPSCPPAPRPSRRARPALPPLPPLVLGHRPGRDRRRQPQSSPLPQQS